ncbi:MAG: hypothetical protein WCQ49_02065 [Candidatus Saccharibacteria bacterium]
MKKRLGYWFKTRPYGYGWVPVTWQGVAIIIGFILFVITWVMLLEFLAIEDVSIFMAVYFSGLVVSVALLLLIVRKHGPKTRWRWGKSDKDNPDTDYIVK